MKTKLSAFSMVRRTIDKTARVVTYGVFLFVVALFSFCVLEYLVGKYITPISAFERKFPAGEVRQPFPYIMFRGKPGARDHNRYGFRGPAPASPKPAEQYRIFVLGGSTVYVGETVDHTVPGQLQKVVDHHFSASERSIKVFNWGVVSGNSGMELARIIYQLVDLEPDMILMYNGGNDIYTPYVYDPRPGFPFNFIAYENNPLYSASNIPWTHVLISRSKLLRPLFYEQIAATVVDLEKVRQAGGVGTETWRKQIRDAYTANVRRARMVSRALGASFHCFFQPMLPYKRSLTEEEKDLIPSDSFAGHVQDMRKLFRKELNNKAAMQLYVHDLSDLFTGRKEHIYTDIIHLKDPFNAVVARAIFSEIADELKLHAESP